MIMNSLLLWIYGSLLTCCVSAHAECVKLAFVKSLGCISKKKKISYHCIFTYTRNVECSFPLISLYIHNGSRPSTLTVLSPQGFDRCGVTWGYLNWICRERDLAGSKDAFKPRRLFPTRNQTFAGGIVATHEWCKSIAILGHTEQSKCTGPQLRAAPIQTHSSNFCPRKTSLRKLLTDFKRESLDLFGSFSFSMNLDGDGEVRETRLYWQKEEY